MEKDTVYWDSELPGFGVRAYATGSRVYVVQTRARGRSRRVTIGRHGLITPDEARRRAALIISRIKSGQPAMAAATAPKGPTVAELAERYLKEHVEVRLKPATVRMIRLDIKNHILPEFGSLRIGAVDYERVAAYHSKLYRVPAMANRVVDTLSAMLSMAETWGLVGKDANPCPRVVKYARKSRERFLTEAEFERLGRTIMGDGGQGRHTAPRGGCAEVADAHRVPVRGDSPAALGGGGSREKRTAAEGFQDGSEDGAAFAGGGEGACGARQNAGRSLGDPGAIPGDAAEEHRPVVVQGEEESGT